MARKKSEPEPPAVPVVPPHNLEAEQAVLGAVLLRPAVMDEISDLLQPADFYRQFHGRIYQAMLGLYQRDDPIDLTTVTARLQEVGWLEEVGGPVFLAQLSEHVGTAANAPYYARLVREKSILRGLLERSQEIAAGCLGRVEDVDEFLNWAEGQVFQVAEAQARSEFQSLEELVPPGQARIEGLHERKEETLGVPSGFIDLDRLTGGFQKKDLIVIGARPSMGKTALALNVSFHAAAKAGVPTAFFSLEMSKEQLVQRLMASEGQINSARLRSGKMDQGEWVKFYQVNEQLVEVPIYISDQAAPTATEIRAQARRLKARQGIGLVVVDYLQLARDPRAKSREQELGGISQALKALAKELDVPVIVNSQLNREVEKRPNKRPIMPDLRGSGSIEQDADLIIFIYRDAVYKENSKDKGIAEVRLAKQRNGPLGLVKLTYREEFMRFENYSESTSGGWY